MMGKNGIALLCVVAIMPPGVKDQRVVEKCEGAKGAEGTPMVSRARLVLAIFGSSLTASHASASLSVTGPIADTIFGEGTTGTGISSTPRSVVRPLALGVNEGVGVGWDGLE
jgi:hypothetical protein